MSSASTIGLPLPISHYSLVSRTIHSILSAEEGSPYKACLFYSIIGAKILNTHYRVGARPIAGAAVYRINTLTPDVIAYGFPSGQTFMSSQERFHSWVETDEWVVDFEAPLFPEVIQTTGQSRPCPRNAFQRKRSEAQHSIEGLRTAGDFMHIPNEDVTRDLLREFKSRPPYMDLVKIATEWFRAPPEPMLNELAVSNARGEVKSVPLLSMELSGSW